LNSQTIQSFVSFTIQAKRCFIDDSSKMQTAFKRRGYFSQQQDAFGALPACRCLDGEM
jgi:hypothetical protein